MANILVEKNTDSEVHAFVPQTFVSVLKKYRLWDRRYLWLHWKVFFMNILYRSQRKYSSLDRWFRKQDNHKTQYHIYYGEQYPLDKIHADQLKSYPNVIIKSYPSWSHYMIKELKESWELIRIIQQAAL
jgi:hypothetical protein